MEHFINIIYKENADSHGIAECIASGSNILTESSIDFYTGELNSSEKIITMALPEAIKDIDSTAQDIAMRLFEFGLKDFDIEITEDETIARTLRRGMRGEDVKRIQREIGMPAADQDGIFGPKTERAVRAFQQNAGIQVDGVVGRQTQSAILKYRMPGTGIDVQKPGPAYIDAPYPKTQPRTGPSELRKRKERERNQKIVTPPDRPVGSLPPTDQRKVVVPPDRPIGQLPRDQRSGVGVDPEALAGVDAGAGVDPDANDPRNREYDSGYRQSDTPSMFATDVDDREATGVWKVIPDELGTYNLVGPDGVVNRSVGQNGRFSQVKVPEMEEYAKRLNREQGLTAPETSDDDAEIDTSNITKPELVTPQGLGQPSVSDTSGISSNSTTDTTQTGSGQALSRPSAPDPFRSPDDVNDRTQRQQQQQDNWEKKYGSAPRDLSAGLPAEFTTQYLNPALDDLTSDAAGDLASELKGAPPPVARLVMDRMRKMLGVEDGDEILDMAREIEQEEPDQASALSTLAEIYKQLEDTAMPKDESVAPRPKGAFMFRERNEWNSQFRNTHNIDGTPKQLTESIEDFEVTYEDDDKFYEDYGVMWYNEDEVVDEAEYQGRKVKLGKPMKGDVKKFKVYVKNPKGNVVKVNFGQKGVKIKKDNPARRRSFRARHNCANPGPRHKARYWSCRKW